MRVYSRTSLLNIVICTRSPSFITSLAHRFKNVSMYSVTKYKLKPQFIKSLAHRFKNVSAYIVTKYEVKPQFIKSLPHRFKNVSAYIVTKYKVKPLPLHKYKTKGDRAFSHFGPSVWNSVPPHIRNAATITVYSLVAPCRLPDLTSLALLGSVSGQRRAF